MQGKPFVTIPNRNIPKGVRLCIENAQRLLEDSQIMFANKRYASALVLAVIAFEELGKALILRDYFLAGKDIDKEIWRDEIKLHQKRSEKLEAYIHKIRGTYLEGYNDVFADEVRDTFNKSKAIQMSKLNKEACLYVDWGNSRWIKPTKGIRAPDHSHESFTEFHADIYSREVKEALTYFAKDTDTIKTLQQEGNYDEPDSDEVIDLIKTIVKRPDGKVPIQQSGGADGLITKVVVGSKSIPLSEEEQRLVGETLRKALHSLKHLSFNEDA